MENNNEMAIDASLNLDNLDMNALDALDEMYQTNIESELEDLSFLEEEREKIGNPDALGKIILDEVWTQFGNQIGLDVTNETTIQKYDREHPETYDEVGKKVMQDQKYKDANKAMKEKQQAGELKDEYTGKTIKQNESANLDHTVSRKEIYENQRRKQANLSTEELANKDENLNPTNEALNKSKGAKSVDDMVATRSERENKLKEQNEAAKKKIDETNMSEADKKIAKENADKRLKDKLDADDEKMKAADKKARKAINNDIKKGAVKEVSKKAGKDALKAVAVSALFGLLKEIMNGLIRFFKEKGKSFKSFLAEMKESIGRFLSHITDLLRTGASSAIGTVVSEIFGPIVSLFKKLASIIKQGATTIIDAIHYLTNKENKDKPLSIKIAQVGKIVTAGLVAAGAIFGGELIEKALLSVPGMQTPIPLLGTLANVIGMFLASMVSGIIGAIIINKLDKFIAKKQASDNTSSQIDKGNQIIENQAIRTKIKSAQVLKTKQTVATNIAERHQNAANKFHECYDDIFHDVSSNSEEINNKNSDELDSLLEM